MRDTVHIKHHWPVTLYILHIYPLRLSTTESLQPRETNNNGVFNTDEVD